MADDGPPPTLVLGFDALSFEYLDAFDLPNFAALREAGVEAPLRATFPPWTASAWPSMYTGVAPANHGVFSFFDFSGGYPDDARLVTRDDVEAPALWNYLAADGDPAVVLNVPVTHPAERIPGAVVPGYLAPEDAGGHPAGVRDDLSAALGEEYRIYADDGPETEGRLDGYLDLVDRRRRAAEHLLGERDWRLAVVQVQKTDAVFHRFDDVAAFRRTYHAADDLLGALVDAHDDANVVVCSDHGIGPASGHKVYVNEVLRRNGLVVDRSGGRTPTLGEARGQLTGAGENGADGDGGGLDGTGVGVDGNASGAREDDPGVGGGDTRLAARALSAAERALRGVGVAPGDVYAAARRVGADGLLRRVLPDGAAADVGRAVDWAASTAYCRTPSELGVRVNLSGREPDGVVTASEYEVVRDRVVEVLSGLTTPDGDPAFDFVRRREAVHRGPRAHRAPDVVFRPAGMDNTVATSMLGSQFGPAPTHAHKQTGVFVAAGPGVDPDADPGTLSLTDVAPTVLALLGRPVPDRMTGRAPPEVLATPPTRESHGDVPYGSDGRDVGEGHVEDRLENLGYL